MNFVAGDKIEIKNGNLILPENVFFQYQKCGIASLFEWQKECIEIGGVLDGSNNLVYSAPTSAGKTLVSELVLLARLLEGKRKALFILPYVSVSREKMLYFTKLFEGIGLKVGGFMGNKTPKGGLATVDIAVCTIEKANGLVNRLIDAGLLDQLGLVVIDELHMLGDSHRGYILELLLTKIIYASELATKIDPFYKKTQLIGMSATLPNLESIAGWLKAKLYICDFRPIPLLEMVKVDSKIYEATDLVTPIRWFEVPTGVIKTDEEQIIGLCLETMLESLGCLVFCPSKMWCEKLGENCAREIFRLCKFAESENIENGFKLRAILENPALSDCIDNLRACPSGLDPELEKIIPFGVAFHHAGLTSEERDIVETNFREGHIKLLVATSTLSSGVNLPARRVIIRTPYFNREFMDAMTYRQMIGRAGRKGIDVKGESILVCKAKDLDGIKRFFKSGIKPVMSCLDKDDSMSLKRALLEIIITQIAKSVRECVIYLNSCFLMHQTKNAMALNSGDGDNTNVMAFGSSQLLNDCLEYLAERDFIVLENYDLNASIGMSKRKKIKLKEQQVLTDCLIDERSVHPTAIGQAVISASLGPEDGLTVFNELDKARRSLALDTDLHLVYLLTPVYLDVGAALDWNRFNEIYSNLSDADIRVSQLIGIKEKFINRCISKGPPTNSSELRTYRRFFSSLILQDLINEKPFVDVCTKFGVQKGNLQALQLQAANYAGMITVFCNRLGWSHLEVLVHSFQTRMTFGVSEQLVDLVRLSIMTSTRARALFKEGYETVSSIAGAKVKDIMTVLRKTLPFQSTKIGDHIEEIGVDKLLGVDGRSISVEEAAVLLVKEAQRTLQRDLALVGISWNPPEFFSQRISNDEEIVPVIENCGSQGAFVVEKDTEETVMNNEQEKIEDQGTLNEKVENITCMDSEDQAKNEELMMDEKSEIAVNGSNNKNNNNEMEDDSFDEVMVNELSCYEEVLKQQSMHSRLNGDVKDIEILGNDITVASVSVKCPSVMENDSFDELMCDIFSSFEEESLRCTLAVSSVNQSSRKSEHSSARKSDSLFDDDMSGISLELSFDCKDQRNLNGVTSQLQESTPKRPLCHKRIRFELALQDKVSSLYQSPIVAQERPAITTVTSKRSTSKFVTPHHRIFVPDSQPLDVVFKEPKLLSSVRNNSKRVGALAKIGKKAQNRSYESVFTSTSLTTNNDSNLSNSDLFGSATNTTGSDLFNESHSNSLFQSTLSDIDNDYMSSVMDVSSNKSHIEQGLSTLNEVSLIQCGSDAFIVDVCKSRGSWKKFVNDFDQWQCGSVSEQKSIDKTIVSVALAWDMGNDTENIRLTGVALASRNVGSVYFIKLIECGGTRLAVSMKRRYEFLATLLSSDNILLVSLHWQIVLRLLEDVLGRDLYDKCHSNLMDPLIMNWILNSENCCQNFLELCDKYSVRYHDKVKVPLHGELMDSIKCNQNKSTIDRDVSVNDKEAALQATVFWELASSIKERFRTLGDQMSSIFDYFITVEIPISLMIINNCSFNVDIDKMKSEIAKVQSTANLLKEMAFECFGKVFNIDNAKEVSRVIFVDLRLPVPGVLDGGGTMPRTRRQTGSKTTATTKKNLAHLVPLHPLPGIILEYRRLLLLIEKTLNPLLEASVRMLILTSNNHTRVKGNYQQLTGTGRINTTNPNIQSVPKPITINWFEILHLHKKNNNNNTKWKIRAQRENIANNEITTICTFRSCFFASNGCSLISADYRQLELRILAHFSGDVLLRQFFDKDRDVDIFINMASQWLKKPMEQVTDEDRQKAKQISYGIIYGISEHGLSEQMDIDVQSAARMIEDFMRTFPGVKKYIQRTIDECRENGYVKTIAGRRRYLPDIMSDNVCIRSHAERQTVHSTIQGSAADIVKYAMVAVHRTVLRDFDRKSMSRKKSDHWPRLMLHLHDELIYEVPEYYLPNMAVILREKMQSTFVISVPLPVKVKTGNIWSTLSDYEQ